MQDNCESDPVRAREIAELADRMIADGYPPHEVVVLWKDNGGIFSAIAARMIRYPVIFQVGGWDECDEEAGDLMFLNSFAQRLPPEIRDAYEQERRVGADACMMELERVRHGEFEGEKHFKWRLDEIPWLVPRIYQEDFFLSVGESTKRAMAGCLWELPRTVRVLFVTQMVLSKSVPREWRERIFCLAFPMCRVGEKEVSDSDPRIGVEVFGRRSLARGAWSGCNRPYRLSYGNCVNREVVEDPDYYPFAVNNRIQEVYADSQLVRGLYVAAGLEGHEAVAAGLWEDGEADDPQLAKFIATHYDGSGGIEPFLMMCDMTGVEFSRGLLRLLVKREMVEALAVYLSDRLDEVERALSVSEVLIYAIMHLPAVDSSALINRVAERAPGIVASASDPFGNNLLWYLLAGSQCTWSESMDCWLKHVDCPEAMEELEDALVSAGCDPGHENHLGMSYAAMKRRSGGLYA